MTVTPSVIGEPTLNYQADSMGVPSNEKIETLGFVDTGMVATTSVPAAVKAGHQNYSDNRLAQFFARPVRVGSYNWLEGTNVDISFDPWQLYFSNPAVIKKLNNYHMMKARLHIRVLINGTPFHYSRAVVSYTPLPQTNQQRLVTSSTRQMELVQKCNLMHNFLDPTTSNSVEMEFPFFYPYEYIRVEEMVLPVESISYLGTVNIMSFNVLKMVSSTASTDLSISVFAWATDVELTIPTTTLISESGNGFAMSNPPGSMPGGESKPNGLISQFSTSVSQVASALTSVPLVGQYANAVGTVSNAVTSVAKAFGWSRPAIETDPMMMRNQFLSSVSTVIGSETIEKLTWDPKQAISVDPGTVECDPHDELTIAMISKRESFMGQINWSSASAEDVKLETIAVNPMVASAENVTGGVRYALSNIAFASAPFEYWSGSIVYRFQVVASAYHGGRLRISYEPYGADEAADNFNTTYSQVIDLTGSRDVSFVVPWASHKPYLKVGTLFSQMGVVTSPWEVETCNGVLHVTVLNELISPDTTMGVTINVFVSAGDDFELTVPSRAGNPHYWPAYPLSESGEICRDSNLTIMMFGDPPDTSNIIKKSQVYVGERITSFRPLLKRYQDIGFSMLTDVTVNAMSVLVAQRYRFPQGAGTSISNNVLAPAYTYTLAGNPYNYNHQSLINYLASGYVAHKGSLRYKTIVSETTAMNANAITVVRDDLFFSNPDATTWRGTLNMPRGYNSIANYNYVTQTNGISQGGAITHFHTKPALEYEMPYLTDRKFSSCGNRETVNGAWTESEYYGDPNCERFSIYVVTPAAGANSNVPTLQHYVATGEDFTFFNYIGPQYLYLEFVTPAPPIAG
jgi:hypothetical protein